MVNPITSPESSGLADQVRTFTIDTSIERSIVYSRIEILFSKESSRPSWIVPVATITVHSAGVIVNIFVRVKVWLAPGARAVIALLTLPLVQRSTGKL